MKHIPNNIKRNSKSINLKEIQDINKSIGNGQKIMIDFNWILFSTMIAVLNNSNV